VAVCPSLGVGRHPRLDGWGPAATSVAVASVRQRSIQDSRRWFRGALAVCARGGSNPAARVINLVREWRLLRLPGALLCRGFAARRETTANQ
jgi:hypothetical protein